MDVEHIRHHVEQYKNGSANGKTLDHFPIAPLQEGLARTLKKTPIRDQVEEVFKMTKIESAAAGKKLIKGLPLFTESEIKDKETGYIIALAARRAEALTVELPRMPILWGYEDKHKPGTIFFTLDKHPNVEPIQKLEFYVPPEDLRKPTPDQDAPSKKDIDWAHDILTRAAKLGVRE